MTSAAAPRSSFVTVMAWLSLAVGVLGVAANALQALALLLMPQLADLGVLLPPGMPQPALLGWLSAHMMALTLWTLVLCALMTWISWALLQRREWARRAFIAGLVLAALLNFACIPLLDASALVGLVPAAGLDGDDGLVAAREAMAPMLLALRLACWIGAIAIAALHGWIVWQLCHPQVRAEFES